MFIQLLFDQCLGKWSCPDFFQADLFQEERKTADMVFMSVCDDKCLDSILVFYKIGKIRNDIVYSRKGIFREHDSAVNDDDFIIMFNTVHVLSNFTKSTQGENQCICLTIDCLFGSWFDL